MVIAIHDTILNSESGLCGDHGIGAIEGALGRIESRIVYAGMDDVFDIAAMYAVAIARGHVFNDANKRTALVTALTYLTSQGINIKREPMLEDFMVEVAEGGLDEDDLAWLFRLIAGMSGD